MALLERRSAGRKFGRKGGQNEGKKAEEMRAKCELSVRRSAAKIGAKYEQNMQLLHLFPWD